MEKQINLSLQVVPVNTKDSYAIIDRAIAVIEASGVNYMVGPFSTSMEGGYEELMAIVEEVKTVCLAAGTAELLLNIQIHIKKEADVNMEAKIAGR